MSPSTRFEISFAVIRLSRFNAMSSQDSLVSVQKGCTVSQRCWLSFSIPKVRWETGNYCRNIFSSDPDDRKTIGGYCIYLGHNLDSQGSRKQDIVARFCTESEHKFLANIWLISLLCELKIKPRNLQVFRDNNGVTYLVANRSF